jgi:hypothetical protein
MCFHYPFHALLGKTHASMRTGERRRPDLYGSMPKTRQLMFPGNGENPVSALAHVRSHIHSSHSVRVTCVNNEEGHKRAAHGLARNCQCLHCLHVCTVGHPTANQSTANQLAATCNALHNGTASTPIFSY